VPQPFIRFVEGVFEVVQSNDEPDGDAETAFLCVQSAIVKKRLKIKASLYTILQILILTLFEKLPLDQLLKNTELQMTTP
jgi:hypothetical protein